MPDLCLADRVHGSRKPHCPRSPTGIAEDEEDIGLQYPLGGLWGTRYAAPLGGHCRRPLPRSCPPYHLAVPGMPTLVVGKSPGASPISAGSSGQHASQWTAMARGPATGEACDGPGRLLELPGPLMIVDGPTLQHDRRPHARAKPVVRDG